MVYAEPTKEGFIEVGEQRSWYRVTGSIGDRPPLVTLHGGPGATHDYLLSLTELAGPGRAVVHYDQLGNGRSTRLPGAEPGSWTVQRFLDELDALLNGLRIAEDYVLFGQSWGGMLAAEHAVRRPAGLRGLILANSPASMRLWSDAAAELRAALPADVQAALLRHEAAGTTDREEYVEAMRVFYRRHVCRLDPWPEELEATLAAIDADPTVYHTMNGPAEFHVIGSLRNWSIVDRLPAIAVPTLVISGRHDEATPATVQPFAERIRDSRWVVFEESSHMPHIEESARFRSVVEEFLDGLH
ncbi:proline iminopeptidase-family hydrolase [Streptosporangium sp. NPDC005286]|uniref:proline iminopeptidase-family hydrolase n=1 Tax=Streptosporangium sp. NPDC005286 TaxID=3154463 RepID=UPI0033B4EBB9